MNLSACYRPPLLVPSSAPVAIAPRSVAPVDTAPKEAPRMVPPEAYVRTYLALFGALAPLEVQRRARGGDGNQVFDTWNDYVAALGFPDYKLDLPRATEPNALMLAAFERLGDALCDRALERDWRAKPRPAIAARAVFAFDPPKDPVDERAFAAGFDVLHRTFLGYPAALAPTERGAAFFHLYQATVARHERAGAPRSRFSPSESGWATVCYALVRHPELHLY